MMHRISTLEALDAARAAVSSGNTYRVFDWQKAARLIHKHMPAIAEAGLAEDWDKTETVIWCDDHPVMGGAASLASVWATPILVMDGLECDCYFVARFEPIGWEGRARWPDNSAKVALGQEEV